MICFFLERTINRVNSRPNSDVAIVSKRDSAYLNLGPWSDCGHRYREMMESIGPFLATSNLGYPTWPCARGQPPSKLNNLEDGFLSCILWWGRHCSQCRRRRRRRRKVEHNFLYYDKFPLCQARCGRFNTP